MSIAVATVRVSAWAKASCQSGGRPPSQLSHGTRSWSGSAPAVPQRSYMGGMPSRRQRAASCSSSPSGYAIGRSAGVRPIGKPSRKRLTTTQRAARSNRSGWARMPVAAVTWPKPRCRAPCATAQAHSTGSARRLGWTCSTPSESTRTSPSSGASSQSSWRQVLNPMAASARLARTSRIPSANASAARSFFRGCS